MFERYFSVLLFIITCIFAFFSYKIEVFETEGLIGSGFFPQVLSTLLVLITLVYILISFKKKHEQKNPNIQLLKKQAFLILNIISTFILVFLIGMLPALGLFIFTSNYFLAKLSVIKSTFFSVGLVLMTYIVFVIGLNIKLPLGKLFS